jgi:hypothetical protein
MQKGCPSKITGIPSEPSEDSAMGTIADIAELLIYIGVFIAVLIFVDHFWTILTFAGRVYINAMNRLDERRARRENSVGARYKIRVE